MQQRQHEDGCDSDPCHQASLASLPLVDPVADPLRPWAAGHARDAYLYWQSSSSRERWFVVWIHDGPCECRGLHAGLGFVVRDKILRVDGSAFGGLRWEFAGLQWTRVSGPTEGHRVYFEHRATFDAPMELRFFHWDWT